MKQPLIGDLSDYRITPVRPFSRKGVDFEGPFQIKMHLPRQVQHIKAYLCVFVCFTRKSVDLEVVTDLTTDSSIAALARFVSRRSLCKDIYCDYGTNLAVAEKKLLRMFYLKKNSEFSKWFCSQTCHPN